MEDRHFKLLSSIGHLAFLFKIKASKWEGNLIVLNVNKGHFSLKSIFNKISLLTISKPNQLDMASPVYQ